MSQIHCFTSNNIQTLTEMFLLKFVGNEDPMNPNVVLMQGAGLERYLEMEIVKKYGICANTNFSFPIPFLLKLALNLPEYNDLGVIFDKDTLMWEIRALLPQLLDKTEFFAVKKYFQTCTEFAWFQFTEKIAFLFDQQYQLFRADMINAWENNNSNFTSNTHETWQRSLWNMLVTKIKAPHRLQLRKSLFESLKNKELKLPDKIILFGISSLSPFEFSVFQEFAKYSDVSLFMLSPSQEYWSDMFSREENSLLGELGQQGGDFCEFLFKNDIFFEHEKYIPTGEKNLISILQNDLLFLRPNKFIAEQEKITISDTDNSLIIQICHSHMREVETLHDQILDLLSKDKNLSPNDFLVISPNIELYAPYIEAVFQERTPKLDYRLIDRKNNKNIFLQGIEKLFSAGKDGFSASLLLDFLNFSPVQKKFSLNDSKQISIWIEKTKIVRCIDSVHKEKFGDLPQTNFTWLSGLERLLLGICMPDDDKLFADTIVPFGDIEGDQIVLLGNLLNALRVIFDIFEKMQKAQDISNWRNIFLEILEDIFEINIETENFAQDIRSFLFTLEQGAQNAGFSQEIQPETIRLILKQSQKSNTNISMLTGGIIFCEFVPMRTLPYKAICLLGMNSGSFPRKNTTTSFDLIATEPRQGDINPQIVDKYLFLEILLSVQQYLYVSYIGRDINENKIIPPSSVINSLIEYVDNRFTKNNKPAAQASTTIQHLHGFHFDYFDSTTNFFSYNQENFLAAKNYNLNLDIPVWEYEIDFEVIENISLNQLQSFFRNPAKYFAETVLQINFWSSNAKILNEEIPRN